MATETPGSGDPKPSAVPARYPLPDHDASLMLLRRAQGGDRSALDDLIRRYEPRLRRVLRARLARGPRALLDLDDIAQLTLEAASRQIAGFRPDSAAGLLSWLATIAASKISDEVDRRRAAKRDHQRDQSLDVHALDPSSPDPSPSQALYFKELERLFDAAVHDLHGDQREVVILRDYCGHEWDEIARRLSRESVRAARQLHQRAWIALRRALGPQLR